MFLFNKFKQKKQIKIYTIYKRDNQRTFEKSIPIKE